MALPEASQHELTYADYLKWDDRERWELLAGAAYAMSPAPSVEHQRWVGELFAQIRAFLRERPCEVLLAPLDVILAEAGSSVEEADTVVQPDLLVVCDETKLEPRGCVGAPDWVIEVLSPATAARDHGVKRSLYERHGVEELWLVHPGDRTVFVYRLDDGRYGAPEVREAAGCQAVAGFPGLEIDWDDGFR